MKRERLSSYEIRLRDHAHERYVERVGPIDRNDLEQWCKKEFARRFWFNKKIRVVEFAGTWWGYEIVPEGYVLLTTCYGKGNIDLVQAIRWAEYRKDKINLKSLV